MIEQLLRQLGFNDKQVVLYIALYKRGKASATELSNITGINRTTVYSVAQELLDKGVISQDYGVKSEAFVALEPDVLKSILDKEKQQIRRKEHVVEDAVEELLKIPQEGKYNIPKIRFITQKDMEQFLRQQSHVWNKSLIEGDKTWWAAENPKFVAQYYKNWLDWYWQLPETKEITINLLTNDSQEQIDLVKLHDERRKIKLWEPAKDLTGTIWVTGDYIVMGFVQQEPNYLVEIKDKALAHNQRELFKGIWGGIKK